MMKRNPLFKILPAFIVLMMIVAQTDAQQGFAYKAILDEVKQSGFYKITLSPEIIAKCQPGMIDLRIMDHGKQVGYIIKQEEHHFAESSFIEFPIIGKVREADKQTHITIENKTGKAITGLLLMTTNMDAKRVVNISGSNDLKEWFIIKEGVYLDNYFSPKEEERIETISLPLVNYKYFQVTILGKDILPFNIQRAGVYADNYIQGKYKEVPLPAFTQIDSSDKKTYVQLRFKEAYMVDKVVVDVDGPKFFKRNVTLYQDDWASTRLPYSAYISSPVAELYPERWSSKKWGLVINNEDNQPLKVKTIKVFQLTQYLLTYLDAGKNYELRFGDSSARAPVYDLAFFKDSIGKSPPELAVKSIVSTKRTQQITASSKDYFSKIILWCIIVAVILLLLAFTYKMIKEINGRTTESNE